MCAVQVVRGRKKPGGRVHLLRPASPRWQGSGGLFQQYCPIAKMMKVTYFILNDLTATFKK
jgi:hypothetical protein